MSIFKTYSLVGYKMGLLPDDAQARMGFNRIMTNQQQSGGEQPPPQDGQQSFKSFPDKLTAIQEFRAFRDKVDEMTAVAWEKYKSKMECKAGCSMCCKNDFKISLIECYEIKEAVEKLSDEQKATIKENLADEANEYCPLLINDRCSIYEDRPLLCRVFGFPIARQNTDGSTSVYTCELNFVEEQGKEFEVQGFDGDVLASTAQLCSEIYLEEMGIPLPIDQPAPVYRIKEIFQGPVEGEAEHKAT